MICTVNQPGPIRITDKACRGNAYFGECDECKGQARVYATGRERKSSNSNPKPEHLCERCVSRLSTDDDPMGVMA